MSQSRYPRELRTGPRSTPLSRSFGVLLIAATVISLFLAGGGAAIAQTPTPQQYGPLTPEEQKRYQEAEENVGVPTDSPYPYAEEIRRPEPSGAPAESFAVTPEGVTSWAAGLCVGGEQCLTGDFNGDKIDDVAVAVRDTQSEPTRGDIKVALSSGQSFSTPATWATAMCYGSQDCQVGDVNADGKDDIVAFNRYANAPVRARAGRRGPFAGQHLRPARDLEQLLLH